MQRKFHVASYTRILQFKTSVDYTELTSGIKKLKPAQTLHSKAKAFSHNKAYYLFSANHHWTCFCQ